MIEVAGGILIAVFVLVTLPFWIVALRFVLALAVLGGIAATVFFVVAARAEEVKYITPEIPDEVTKIEALKLAYELNGNSMVRAPHLGNIDLSGPTGFSLPKADRIIPLTKPQNRKTAP